MVDINVCIVTKFKKKNEINEERKRKASEEKRTMNVKCVRMLFPKKL
jgi:hypothetical protein